MLAMTVGCPPRAKTVGQSPPAAVDHVDRLVLPTSPVPLNWDQNLGADGLAVQVFFFRPAHGDLPVTVTGTVEFLLYEGLRTEGDSRAQPIHTWRFTGRELKAYTIRAAWGWGYAMRLGWGDRPPKTTSVTLQARYVPLTGPSVNAQPIIIPVGPR